MSLTHLLLILVIILLVFGPSRLPGLGKGFGDAVRGFKKALKEDDTIDVTDISKRAEQIRTGEDDPATQAARARDREKDKTRS